MLTGSKFVHALYHVSTTKVDFMYFSSFADCLLGTYAALPESLTCTICPKDHYCPDVSQDPIPCDDGQFR